MITSADLLKVLRGTGTIDPLDIQELTARAQARVPTGFLYGLGRALDYPGRVVRRAITGMPEPTGRDVLQKIGLLGRNRPGFDVGDVLGFGTEIALDPLMLVSGLGTLTKAGRLAGRVGKLGKEVGAIKAFGKEARNLAERQLIQELAKGSKEALAKTMAKLPEGAAKKLAPSWAAQARADVPQRALVSILGRPAIRGAPVLGAMQKMGQWLGKRPSVEFLRKVFKSPIPPELQPILAASRMLAKRGVLESAEEAARLKKVFPGIVEKTGLSPEEFNKLFRRGRESRGIPEKIYADMDRVAKEGEEAANKLTKLYFTRRKAGLTLQAKRVESFYKKKIDRLVSKAEDVRPYDPVLANELLEPILRLEHTMKGRIPEILKKPLTESQSGELFKRQLKALAPSKAKLAQQQERMGMARENLEALAQASPEGYAEMERMGRGLETLAQEQIRVGARHPKGLLRAEFIAYAERHLSQTAKQWLKETGNEEKLRNFATSRIFTTKTPSHIKREEGLLEIYTDAVNEFFKKHKPDLDGHWFELDPTKTYPQALSSGRLSIAMAQLWQVAVKKLATTHVPGKTLDVAEFIHRGPLYRLGDVVLPKSAKGVARKLDKMGLGGKGIPNDAANFLLDMHQRIQAPEQIAKLMRGFDAMTSIYRIGATLPWPAFHIRNMISDTTLNWMGDVPVWDPRLWKRAIQTLRNPAAMREIEPFDLYRGISVRAAAEVGPRAGVDTAFTRFAEKHPRFKEATTRALEVAEVPERITRTMHYLAKRDQGYTPFEAAQSVKKWLLDYTDLSKTERELFRRMFFFYQWPRKVLPVVLKAYFEKPQKMAALTRVATQPSMQRGGVMPEFVRQSAGIPLGGGPEGYGRWLIGMGLPLEELNRIDLTSPRGAIPGTLRRMGTQLNPLLRAPIELMTGKDLFLNKDLLLSDRAYPALRAPGLKQAFGVSAQPLPGGQTRYRGDPYRLWILRNLPFLPRAARTAGQLADVVAPGVDVRQTGLEGLAQALAGVKIARLDKADLLRALEQINRERLTAKVRTGEAGILPVMFARKLQEGKSPEVMEVLRENRDIRKLIQSLEEAQKTGSRI